MVVVVVTSSSGGGDPYEVRAIFDDASFAVPGEDVRIAGAPVGTIASLAVTNRSGLGGPNSCKQAQGSCKAVVTLTIGSPGFTPFHQNALCEIRPQSLIGEKYVDCNPGTSAAPPLTKITSGPGAGTYLLPVTNTRSPIDTDLVTNIYREPVRQWFGLIINEFGTGLAARGSDLNEVIHRANPALGYTDQVLKILAKQNKQLAQLAKDSDTVLTPLANDRQAIKQWVLSANTTSVATAVQADNTARSFHLLPSFLQQLRPLLADLGALADQATPVLNASAQAAPALALQNQALSNPFRATSGFADITRRSLISLGQAADKQAPLLLSTIPLDKQLLALGTAGLPAFTNLDKLLSSLNQTGAIESLMTLLFNGTSAVNGFDSAGHYPHRGAGRKLHGLRKDHRPGLLGQLHPSDDFRGRGRREGGDRAEARQADQRRADLRPAQRRHGDARWADALPDRTGRMNLRRRERGLFASPVLIGAVTVLVAIVAVFLAYNANNGLPFVPRYSLHVRGPRRGEELTQNAEVHMAGGTLVGHVTSINPGRTPNGQPIAILNLALNKSIQPLAVNSTWRIRLKATIGLKYLQLTPGNSSQTLANGATVPVLADQCRGRPRPGPIPVRRGDAAGVVATTTGYGEALAGRGIDINKAIGAFVPLVRDLGPVMRNLSSKKTDLAGFFHGLENFSSAVAPVAQQQADLYVNMATTFTSLASVAVPFFQDWIKETPPTLQTVITDAPIIGPFVQDTTALFAELEPGFKTLPQSAPVLAQAFVKGTENLPATYQGPDSLNNLLTSLAQSLSDYTKNPPVLPGYQRLTLLAQSLGPPLKFLTPAQTTCNYVTLFLRNTADLLSLPVSTGTRLRFSAVAIDDVLGAESVPSQKVFTTPDPNQADAHGPLHVDPYPNTAAPGQVHECSAGNEPYSDLHPTIGNPAGNVGITTEKTKKGTR